MVALIIMGENYLHYFEVVLMMLYLVSILRIGYKNRELSMETEKQSTLLDQYLDITDKSIIISRTDLKGVITHVNDNFCNISGFKSDELIGKNHSILRHPEVPEITFKKMWDTISIEKKSWHGILKNRAKNGDSYYVSTTVSPILDVNNNVKEYIALRHDITAIMSDKKQLFDYLETNKLNVLIMIQIEDYGTLEKFYDKSSVEEIEKRFGSAILYLLPNDCDFERVYYLENGLYALAKSRRLCKKSTQEIENILQEFLQNLKEYVVKLDKIEYDISAVCSFTYGVIQTYEDAKIGIEKAIEDKKSIIYADGFSGVEYAIALQNIETLHTLKTAIEDKKVISYFQPIVDNTTRKVSKYESLVRIVDEFGRVVPPDEFIDIAKKGRYYSQVTKIVLENSFKILLETDKEISINLSALDIESVDMRKKIFALLDEYKDQSNRVIFELLESEDIKNFNVIVDFIKKVKLRGVKIAIDDFGTGYSNFSRLLQYEPDLLKVDGSLIKNIKDNELSKNIVETIVLFAKKQKIKTVAEFVENEEVYNIVKEMGIDYSQGYAFGKPEELI
jgi:PAS domain S-box-containing protein